MDVNIENPGPGPTEIGIRYDSIDSTTRPSAIKGLVTGVASLGALGAFRPSAHAATSRGERLTASATVLLLDTSNFVFTRGSFPAVREAALALSALIRERFPQDTLALIAFTYLAREIEPAELPLLAWDNSYGNNVQHGLTLARQILTSSAARKKNVFLVSEGQVPTAHMENGQCIFSYPPTHACITTTLAEVEVTTRESIALYTFLLRHSGDLDSFVDHLRSIKNSHVLYASPESLTETILTQYVRNKG